MALSVGRILILALLGTGLLAAGELRGLVKLGVQPVPGAT